MNLGEIAGMKSVRGRSWSVVLAVRAIRAVLMVAASFWSRCTFWIRAIADKGF